MVRGLAWGRKNFAIDLWKDADADCDPDVTYYSKDPEYLESTAKYLKEHAGYAKALLYERTSETPDWETVESLYWRLLREIN